MEKPNFPLLAVDFGEKHFGLALSDPSGSTAMLLPELHTSPALAVEQVVQTAVAYKAQGIVVGAPIPLSGQSNSSKAVEHFIGKLKQATLLPIYTFNELLSSKLAGSGKNSHSQAARIILQGYLDTLNTEHA